jgi:DNA-binding transcriptional LysR family regulator
MELRHLRYFVAVAEELHFGRAARRLNIAASPLSQRIRECEKELGVPLFVRTSRKVTLTEEGRLFLEHVRPALAQLDKAHEAIHAAHRGRAGRIAIGAVPAATYSLVPAILREFNHLRPAVDIRFLEMSSTQQRAALLERRIDVGFTRQAAADPAMQATILAKERLCVALPADHPRAHQENLRLADLASDGFILFSRHLNPELHDWIIAACQDAGFSPRVAQEGNDAHTILALVAAGLGVAMVTASLQKLTRPEVVYRDLPLQDTREIELSLVWRRREHSPLVEIFVKTAQAVAQTMHP